MSQNSNPQGQTKYESAGAQNSGPATDKLNPIAGYGGAKSVGSAVTAGKSGKIGKGGGSMSVKPGHE